VLSGIDPDTGNLLSNSIVGQYFGDGSVAPLQYSLSGLTYANNYLYGVYQDSFIGYPAVLAKIDPHTGNLLSTSIIGQHSSASISATLPYQITGLAYGGGELYGVYRDGFIGYPAVLAGIDLDTGNVLSTSIIGQHFGDGSVAPLQDPIIGLTYGDGEIYGAYRDSFIGYPAVLAGIDPLTGNVLSTSIIGQQFGDGSVAPLPYPITGLAFVDSPTAAPEPGTWAMMIAGFGLVGAALRRRQVAERGLRV
jgi:hypothetical protein